MALMSCTELELDYSPGQSEEDSLGDDFSWVDSEGVRNALRRASQLAMISWVPRGDIPWNGGVFQAGLQFTGIPYSSTKQINKYVGLDVSFHTFMTAVHNPFSVLYTEDLSKAPYNGTNCATYYGAVCSTLVDYALGFSAPLPSNWLVLMPEFEKNPDQSLEYLRPGDIMHMPGHVFMIYRTAKTASGKVTDIIYIEAAGKICRFVRQTADEFENRIKANHLVSYRYKDIDSVSVYNRSDYVAVGREQPSKVTYNSSLCPNRGDCSVYRKDEVVIVNVMDDRFKKLVVIDTTGESMSFDAKTITHVGYMRPGMYSAFAANGSLSSDTISFYVADPQVSVSNQGKLHVTFSCEDCPALYCVLCNRQGDFYYYKLISEMDRQNGYIEIDPLGYTDYYCKVVFQTPYGTVVNSPIKIIG